MKSLLRRPSAWLPITLALIVLAAWAISIVVMGLPKPEPDEGTAAHLFQVCLVTEALMILFFSLRWLPERPAAALAVMVVQILLVLLGDLLPENCSTWNES